MDEARPPKHNDEEHFTGSIDSWDDDCGLADLARDAFRRVDRERGTPADEAVGPSHRE
jgi:hypothetical protein